MNLEKRSEGSEESNSTPTPQTPVNKQKPVFFYIVILFAVAFALILVSFFMHQRSNQEVLGELHNNVNALEQLQDALDENLRLEKELDDAQTQLTELRQQLEASQSAEENAVHGEKALQDALVAMEQLHLLQQQYAAQDYKLCQETIAAMESSELVAKLPTKAPQEGVVSPAGRYGQLKEAVTAKLEA